MSKQITFGSLFAGIGGFDLGFERAGLTCKWQVEIDDYATRVLEKHWPDVHRERDIRECGKHNLEYVDVICGGDPCQGNSIANAVHNTTHPDLGSHLLRVVDELRPWCVVRENPAVTKADAPWTWQRMRSELERRGYAVMPIRFTARAVGRDHSRNRIILIAEDTDTNCQRSQRFDWKGFSSGDVRGVDRDAMLPLTQPEDLRASPSRCGVCDGVPDRTHRLRGIGNAVVPQVAEWIGHRITEAAQ